MNDGARGTETVPGAGAGSTAARDPARPGRGHPSRPRSDRATWTLWLGLAGIGLGFLLMFAVLTPAALVCGTRALREIRARPELTGRTRAWTGMGLALVAPLLWVGLFVGLLVDGAI